MGIGTLFSCGTVEVGGEQREQGEAVFGAEKYSLSEAYSNSKGWSTLPSPDN